MRQYRYVAADGACCLSIDRKRCFDPIWFGIVAVITVELGDYRPFAECICH